MNLLGAGAESTAVDVIISEANDWSAARDVTAMGGIFPKIRSINEFDIQVSRAHSARSTAFCHNLLYISILAMRS
jgi:hypothetical protein